MGLGLHTRATLQEGPCCSCGDGRLCPGPAWTILTVSVSSSAQTEASPAPGGSCLPPSVFGNGRTHTGEVTGSGGSRLANYGARTQPAPCAQPAREGHAGPAVLREEGGDSGPGLLGSGRGQVQLEVTLCVSLHPPEVTGPQDSWEAVLWPSGGAAKRSWGPALLQAVALESESRSEGTRGCLVSGLWPGSSGW